MEKYHQYTNNQLVALLKEGSELAYGVIYDRYKTILYHHAYKKTGDPDEAQDLLQDVFLTLWNCRHELNEDGNLPGYLYTTLRNKIFNLFSHKKVRNTYEVSLQHFAENGTIQTDHRIRERQMSELIESEISAIPQKMREIFVLSRKEHLKNKEIAQLLGISEHTVATQIKRALKVLRLRIGFIVLIGSFVFYILVKS